MNGYEKENKNNCLLSRPASKRRRLLSLQRTKTPDISCLRYFQKENPSQKMEIPLQISKTHAQILLRARQYAGVKSRTLVSLESGEEICDGVLKLAVRLRSELAVSLDGLQRNRVAKACQIHGYENDADKNREATEHTCRVHRKPLRTRRITSFCASGTFLKEALTMRVL